MITEVGPAGEILEPKEFIGRFHNVIGALVRDQLNPTISSLKDVPAKKKGELWDKKLKLSFRFLEDKHELVKLHAFKIMGESFQRWRSDLNKKYIQKELTPCHEFGNITPSQWEELVAQKTTPEALALSARNIELVKRNQHHHHLGPGGYYGKEEKFRKMEEEAATSRKLNLKGLKLRS